ncbi:MAG: zinc ribbon domain-containing protein [Nitrososphaeria archaeon]
MPFCPKCGKKISEDANFCESCGYDLRQERSLSIKTLSSQPVKASKEQQPIQVEQAKVPAKRKSSTVGVIIVSIIIILVIFFVIGLLLETIYGGTGGSFQSPSVSSSTTYSKMGITVEDFKPQKYGDKTYYTMAVYDGKAKIVNVNVSAASELGDSYMFSVRLDILPTTSTKVKAYGLIFYGKERPPNIGIFNMGGVSALNYLEIKKFQTDDGKGVIYANDDFWLVKSGWDIYIFVIKQPFPQDITVAAYFVIEKNGIALTDINSHFTLPVASS